jgi:ATP/maltotriose-dependent transcriptional regulator MalT
MDAAGWSGSSSRPRPSTEESPGAILATVVALLEQIARIQEETAELLYELAHTQNKAATQPLSKARNPVRRLDPVRNSLPAQPGPGGRQPRRPASQGRSAGLAEPLTRQERAVLRMLATGLSLCEIGQELYVSRNTVKSHTSAIYRKLGVSSRHEAVQRGRELAILPQLASTGT